jgi:restriction endonuclease Mrr
MAHRSPAMAIQIARRAFSATDAFPNQSGAELRDLIQTFCDDEDASWVFDEGKDAVRFRSVRAQLNKVIARFEERRIVPPLRVAGESTTFYRFAVVPDPGEDPATADRRQRYSLHYAMLDALRSIEPGDFESLCARILRQIGCSSVYTTRGSQDYGVDFFGRMPIAAVAAHGPPALSPVTRVLGGLSMFLFGQAKRYGERNVVSDEEVKLLEATLRDIRRARWDRELHPDIERGVEHVGWRAADPILLVFATTSSYTRRALEFARREGMATLDGDQLSQLLLDAGLGIELSADGAWITSVDVIVAACR